MAAPLRRQEKRHWFSDDRTPARRMGVSWHPENGLMVLSLWQGNECTATFRLPIDDAARLIEILARGLGDSAEVIHLVDRRH